MTSRASRNVGCSDEPGCRITDRSGSESIFCCSELIVFEGERKVSRICLGCKGLVSVHARLVTLMIPLRAKTLSRHLQIYSRLYRTKIRLPSGNNSSANEDGSSNSVDLSKHPHAQADAYAAAEEQSKQDPELGLTTLPFPPQSTHPRPSPSYSSMHPPFHTHQFVSSLERCLPTPIARTLMRSTRAMLIDKIGDCRRQGLGKKDMENVSLFVTLRIDPKFVMAPLASVPLQGRPDGASERHCYADTERYCQD